MRIYSYYRSLLKCYRDEVIINGINHARQHSVDIRLLKAQWQDALLNDYVIDVVREKNNSFLGWSHSIKFLVHAPKNTDQEDKIAQLTQKVQELSKENEELRMQLSQN